MEAAETRCSFHMLPSDIRTVKVWGARRCTSSKKRRSWQSWVLTLQQVLSARSLIFTLRHSLWVSGTMSAILVLRKWEAQSLQSLPRVTRARDRDPQPTCSLPFMPFDHHALHGGGKNYTHAIKHHRSSHWAGVKRAGHAVHKWGTYMMLLNKNNPLTSLE